MFNPWRAQPHWGVSLQPGALAVTEWLPRRRGPWRLGRQLQQPLLSAEPWLDTGEWVDALAALQVTWDAPAAAVSLAIDDLAMNEAELAFPTWLQADDLVAAVALAWSDQLGGSEAWALDHQPLADVDNWRAEVDLPYRVFGLVQQQVDGVREALAGHHLQLQRLQPSSLALYHGVMEAVATSVPHWVFSLSDCRLSAMGPNAHGAWVSRAWPLPQHADTSPEAGCALAVTQGDGSPWWAAELLEPMLAFVERETQERTWPELRWVVLGEAGPWGQTLAQSLAVFWSRLPHVQEVQRVDVATWSDGLDALGAVWPEHEAST